jgi:hypothetical protein
VTQNQNQELIEEPHNEKYVNSSYADQYFNNHDEKKEHSALLIDT